MTMPIMAYDKHAVKPCGLQPCCISGMGLNVLKNLVYCWLATVLLS